jgi:predicted amidohydrolase
LQSILIKSFILKGVDLVVFPEYSLTTRKVCDDRELALDLSQLVPDASGEIFCAEESAENDDYKVGL